jgi:hypothetical protein
MTARAALRQGCKLFIPDACFADKSLSWPTELEARSAIPYSQPEEVLNQIVNCLP